MTYRGFGTEIALPGSTAYKQYWDARAKQCKMFADEGSCLARVARHVPVTIGGLGQAPGGASGVVVGIGLTAALITGLVIFGGMSKNPSRRRRRR